MAQEWWQTQLDPATGKPFSSYEAANSWAQGQGAKESASAFNTAKPSEFAWGGEAPDWSKTGWNIDYSRDKDNRGEFYRPPDNTFGFQIGDNAGYLDPATGRISYGATGASSQAGYGENFYGSGYTDDIAGPGGSDPSKQWGKETGSGQWDLNYDYGLGNDMLGIIPMEHNAAGQVSSYVAPSRGGGFVRTADATAAKASRDDYVEWLKSNPNGGGIGGAGANTGAATAPAGGASSTPVTEAGLFTTPGQGESYFDKTKDFYTKPTSTEKAWEASASQPTEAQQQWEKQAGRFNDSTTEQSKLWDVYGADFQNPGYLDDFYSRAAGKAQTTLDRKASSGGWGDSGAAARATSNIDRNFADQALLARQGWMQTGMGLAGNSDTSMNEKDKTGMGLAGAADASFYDKTRTGLSVDAGKTSRIAQGQSASAVAQGLTEGRETGGLNSARQIASDMSQLALQGFTTQQSEDAASAIQEISVRMQAGKLSSDQAYAEAQELLKGMGVALSSSTNAWLATRLGAKNPTSSTSLYDPVALGDV